MLGDFLSHLFGSAQPQPKARATQKVPARAPSLPQVTPNTPNFALGPVRPAAPQHHITPPKGSPTPRYSEFSHPGIDRPAHFTPYTHTSPFDASYHAMLFANPYEGGNLHLRLSPNGKFATGGIKGINQRVYDTLAPQRPDGQTNVPRFGGAFGSSFVMLNRGTPDESRSPVHHI